MIVPKTVVNKQDYGITVENYHEELKNEEKKER